MAHIISKLRKHWVSTLLGLILVISFFLMVFSARSDSMVVDEKVHISAGYLHVWQGDYTFNPEHPPLLNDLGGLFTKLSHPNLPKLTPSTMKSDDQWEYGDQLFYGSGNNVDAMVFFARLPFILLTLALIYLVFLWGKTVFSSTAGLVAAALIAFDPNILAHGRLATTDIGLVFFFLLTIWILRKYILKPTFFWASILAVVLALAILSKFSAVFLLPLVLVGIIYAWIKDRSQFGRRLLEFLLMIVISTVLIWLVYAFSMRAELISLPATYQLTDYLGGGILHGTLSKILLMPFDKYFVGYRMVAEHNLIGHWNYLNGVVSVGPGWWYYFPLVLLYKLTLPALILIGLGLIFLRPKIRELIYLLLPALFFFALAMTSKIDIGIRHILVILPFLYILAGGVIVFKNTYLKPIVILLIFVHVILGILAYPNYLAYFNPIAGGSRGGIEHLIDSNLDWNQNIKRFATYAKKNNLNNIYQFCWDGGSFQYRGIENQFLPSAPVNGIVAICAHQLEIKYNYDFSWVTAFPPDDVVSEGIYIWRFDKKPVELR